MLISSLGVLSHLASSSMLPQLMDQKFYSKGNAIISTIYPLSNVFVAPLMMILLKHVGLSFILILYGVACLIDAKIESHIDESFEFLQTSESLSLSTYISDLKQGYQYLRNDQPLFSVFMFFSLVMFANGVSSLAYPYFNQSPTLTNTDYGLMLSFQSAGYMFGGFFHYFVRIPDHKRYLVAIIVYFTFSILDGFYYFFPFTMMLVIRFILGFGGMNSANIRISAIQHRVHNTYRAKINAMFSISFTLFEIMGQLGAGYLGEFFEIRWLQLAFNAIYFISILIFVLPSKFNIKELYNYQT